MARRPSRSDNAVLRQMESRGVFAPDEFDAWLGAQGKSWQAMERGDYGHTLEDALIAWVFSDPVRFCETFLVEPRTGDPWRFFEYQRESLRAWSQDAVHQDGAEVGKTREIVCMILWGMVTSMGGTVKRPSMLIGAPQQTHLDEIILAVEEQMGVQMGGEHAKGSLLSQFWLKPKRTPHTMHNFITLPIDGEAPGRCRVYYRPAGHDGEAFRGVHVNGMVMMDEAAKLKRAVQWSEFWRSAMPGCRKRVYSVPDGDRSTDYFRMTQQATPSLEEGKPGMRLFHWPKTIMPAPFWSTQRDEQFARDFGGRQTPGYQRNVLGLWGDAENPVWSWETVLPCVHDIPDFRIIKLAADQGRGLLAIEVKRCSLHMEGGRKSGTDEWLVDTTIDLSPFIGRDSDEERREAVRDLLREHVVGAARGVFWAGADLGESNDPTEIILSEEIGPKMHDVLRVQLRGFPYYLQREVAYALQELFGWLPHWGVDLGSAGTAVVRDLQTMDAYASARFDETLTGFQFSNSVDCLGEDGDALLGGQEDDYGERAVIRAPAKHWATQCITRRMQQRGYAMAYDTEALNWMTNHTAREGAKWPIYSKKDDHAIDARRVQMLRKLYDEVGGAIDVFSVGAYRRNAA